MKKVVGCFLAVIAVIALLGLGFLIDAGVVWVICWAFGLEFTWKIAVGAWLIIVFVSAILRSIFKNKE